MTHTPIPTIDLPTIPATRASDNLPRIHYVDAVAAYTREQMVADLTGDPEPLSVTGGVA